ncbi:hypothetical protein MHY87_07220 [Microvirga sp. ACRRW]|uniref:hypothetical protein n=1 Tax=Microvirga sp. ACRRW TaxID=2918205 RepID=UPI001EF3E080|nr:hypothetical protein [Microvirga sp. ACRRW]MCG7392691.1 hypothetical protein [Microvirga sp. ACRRW]
MNDTEFRNNKSSGNYRQISFYSPTIQPLLQSLLSTLADLDFEYEQERDKINKSSPDLNLRIRVLEKLRAQHHERRTPYIQQLAVLQERMIPHR